MLKSTAPAALVALSAPPPFTKPVGPTIPVCPASVAKVLAATVPVPLIPSVPVFAVSATVGAVTTPVTVIVGAVMVAEVPAPTVPTPSVALSLSAKVVNAEPPTLATTFDRLLKSTAPAALVALSAPAVMLPPTSSVILPAL